MSRQRRQGVPIHHQDQLTNEYRLYRETVAGAARGLSWPLQPSTKVASFDILNATNRKSPRHLPGSYTRNYLLRVESNPL